MPTRRERQSKAPAFRRVVVYSFPPFPLLAAHSIRTRTTYLRVLMDSMAAYLPQDRRHALAHGLHRRHRPLCRHLRLYPAD